MSKRNYCQTLGVSVDATEDEIKKAYRRLAMKYHPDRNTDADSEAKFKEIKEAYEYLTKYHSAKSAYSSNAGASQTADDFMNMYENMSGNAFGDVFNDLFRRTNTRDSYEYDTYYDPDYEYNRTRRHASEPNDRQAKHSARTVVISLDEAFTGKVLKVAGNTITLPAGVRSGAKMFVGDTLYTIEVQLHHTFKRAADDLLVDVEISCIEAMLSVDVTVDYLGGSKLQFTVPAGIQHGQVVRLAGKGMQNPEIDTRGDLMVRVTITTPKALTDEEVTLLKSMKHRTSINV